MQPVKTMDNHSVPVLKVHTLIIGSGAAALNCADRLHEEGVRDILIVTEHLGAGTSNNSGSDKQTYYKLGVASQIADSPWDMAHSLYDGGSMHGDLALVEGLVSTEAFFHLVSIGVPFPNTVYGGYTGYKTDHDPRQRGTSAGPYTSKMMYGHLLKEVERRGITILDNHDAVALLADEQRCYGAVILDKKDLANGTFGLKTVFAENTVFAVGGPGGLFQASVFPAGHYGAIGLALEIGAEAGNLTESQFGLASTKFRWNVSGTYQQVIPRYISTDQNGGDEQEFLKPWFSDSAEMASAIFLKGYQWPFDPRKISSRGSSLIDILVFIETAVKGRKVFMDFRRNPSDDQGHDCLDLQALSTEARSYLENSGAFQATPIERLAHMNPLAIDLYTDHNIDIRTEPLEIAVCAQHNNGGLHGDLNWESANIAHLFPIGEVNGSHGVYRPGGSALNSGQVGGIRASQKIACDYREWQADEDVFRQLAASAADKLIGLIEGCLNQSASGDELITFQREYQERMTRHAAHIRDLSAASKALAEAYRQVKDLNRLPVKNIDKIPSLLRQRHLVLAHSAYLQAVQFYLAEGGRSRGSYLVLDKSGDPVHPDLGEDWKYRLEDGAMSEKVLITSIGKSGEFVSRFIPRRSIPEDNFWFETIWQEYRQRRGR